MNIFSLWKHLCCVWIYSLRICFVNVQLQACDEVTFRCRGAFVDKSLKFRQPVALMASLLHWFAHKSVRHSTGNPSTNAVLPARRMCVATKMFVDISWIFNNHAYNVCALQPNQNRSPFSKKKYKANPQQTAETTHAYKQTKWPAQYTRTITFASSDKE